VKQKRFTVEQIVAVLKQAEAGVPLAELLRVTGHVLLAVGAISHV
jgi:putative transposase